ncbi:hypothetical protein SAMN05518871_10113 [Psychrobacillus sp. OK028]|nr:hypothetical protein SAMN05518871_10113 [Psychrobacillus sp. OK028]
MRLTLKDVEINKILQVLRKEYDVALQHFMNIADRYKIPYTINNGISIYE